jgi:hypothetical protein
MYPPAPSCDDDEPAGNPAETNLEQEYSAPTSIGSSD